MPYRAIPGFLRGLQEAFNLGARLSWEELFEPAINFAENGFELDGFNANVADVFKPNLRGKEWFEEVWVNPATNDTYKKGDVMKMKKVAKTYRKIVEEGIDSFYNGSLSKIIIKEINDHGW